MSRGSSPAGQCWSSAHLVQCGPHEPSWTWTQIWVQARIPDYSLNRTAMFSAIQGRQMCQWYSFPSRRRPNRWWPSRSREQDGKVLRYLCLWWSFCCRTWFIEVFSFVWRSFFFVFFHYASSIPNLLFTPWEFITSKLADGLSRKFKWVQYQVSRTLLCILAVLNNIVVWIVFTCAFISKPFSPFNNPSVTVPRAPIIISINATFIFHRFFNPLARSRYLSFFSFSLNLFYVLLGDKVYIFASSLFSNFHNIWSSGRD